MSIKPISQAPQSVKNALCQHIADCVAHGDDFATTLHDVAVNFKEWEIGAPSLQYYARTAGVTFPRSAQPAVEPLPIDERVRLERINQDLKERLGRTEAQYKVAQRDETLAERVIGQVGSMVRAMPYAPPARVITEDDEHSEQETLALMSCLHLGEVVDPETMLGIGNYNPEITCARFQYYIDSILDLTFNHHRGENISTINVVNLGDNVSGNIHDELVETNAFPLAEQTVRAAYLLAMGLRDLSHNGLKVKFTGLVGNHGRLVRKPAFKNRHDSMDWVVYHLAQALLADDPNIEFNIPKSWFDVQEINGHTFFFSHGEAIRSAFSFPWYDLSKFMAQMSAVLQSKEMPIPEYWGFGHFHQYSNTMLSYGEYLFTGSFKGPDEYALGKLRAGGPAVELFAGIHPRRGVSFRYPVVLEDATPEKQNRYLQAADKLWTPGSN